MAYFHCLIGGGSSGGGYELTVTCDSAFAGTTITCTDGTTTLTQTCPISSPYEVVFEIPNGGDWTISGTTGGHTVSTGVSIPTSATLIATIQQTVTIYSAKEDTISYVDIDGATQTITFASGESSKQVTIEIEASGSAITFTSGVAKDPSDLSNYYSKTVTITSNTTEVYLMPDNVLYWFGYINEIQAISSANGWSGVTTVLPTFNTNKITLATSGTGTFSGVGSVSSVDTSNRGFKVIGKGTTYNSGFYYTLGTYSQKNMATANIIGTHVNVNSNVLTTTSHGTGGATSYPVIYSQSGQASEISAIWLE